MYSCAKRGRCGLKSLPTIFMYSLKVGSRNTLNCYSRSICSVLSCMDASSSSCCFLICSRSCCSYYKNLSCSFSRLLVLSNISLSNPDYPYLLLGSTLRFRVNSAYSYSVSILRNVFTLSFSLDYATSFFFSAMEC